MPAAATVTVAGLKPRSNASISIVPAAAAAAGVPPMSIEAIGMAIGAPDAMAPGATASWAGFAVEGGSVVQPPLGGVTQPAIATATPAIAIQRQSAVHLVRSLCRSQRALLNMD